VFIVSLVVVTSIAVWAQPQMIQRHFAIAAEKQLSRTAPLAMLVLTVLVGGAYFAAALSRLILPEVANPDVLMPQLVQLLLPSAGVHLFVLAIVSASLSTATALFHIAAMAAAEDVPGRKSTRASWTAGVALCVLVSACCAQAEGRLIAMLCTTSWSMVGAMALVPYVALVRFGRRNRRAAWCSAVGGFGSCLFWYLFLYQPTALVTPIFPELSQVPPFFVGLGFSLAGWGLGLVRGAVPEWTGEVAE
jgi:Na+/pantothenate symporter